jgi:hypothetical protein
VWKRKGDRSMRHWFYYYMWECEKENYLLNVRKGKGNMIWDIEYILTRPIDTETCGQIDMNTDISYFRIINIVSILRKQKYRMGDIYYCFFFGKGKKHHTYSSLMWYKVWWMCGIMCDMKKKKKSKKRPTGESAMERERKLQGERHYWNPRHTEKKKQKTKITGLQE